MKGCTEALICSVQEQAIRTKNTNFYIDKTNDSPCVDCAEKEMKHSHISLANVESWLRKSIKDAMTTLENTYIGNFVRSIILIQKQDGMNTHQKA